MTIGINRPEKRNAVNPETAQELVRAFHQFEEEKDTFVAVLHGTGNYDLLCSCLLVFFNWSYKRFKWQYTTVQCM